MEPIVRTQEEFNDFAAEKLRSLEAQYIEVQVKVAENTALTYQVLDILTMAKTFFRAANWIGRALKWAAGIAAALFTLWQIWKGRAP